MLLSTLLLIPVLGIFFIYTWTSYKGPLSEAFRRCVAFFIRISILLRVIIMRTIIELKIFIFRCHKDKSIKFKKEAPVLPTAVATASDNSEPAATTPQANDRARDALAREEDTPSSRGDCE